MQDRHGEGIALSGLGQVALAHGDLVVAADYFQQSLPIMREPQDREGEDGTLSNLGQVALFAGYVEEALS